MKAKKEKPSRSKLKIGEYVPLRLKGILQSCACIAGAGFLMVIVIFMIVSKYPAVGAEGADWLRGIIGDKAVAGLEMGFFQVQDNIQMWKYELGLLEPAEVQLSFPPPSTSSNFTLGTNTPLKPSSTPPSMMINIVQPTLTATPNPWQPVAIFSFSSARGEGVWIPYIQDAQGLTVAYKTFVQPDPGRPYTLVAIIAIDLTHTRLHYVLGADEPASTVTSMRSGKITENDLAANILLAAFNGGFKARHGQFGAMADGILALPPRDGLGTVVIYSNGEVRLDDWGTTLLMSPDISAFRQNGPLVIREGEINPVIYNNSPQDWGYTVNGVSPTVRSGIGLSRDNSTLYYFCGPSLSMESLAKSMQAAGAYNAIQLDINNYWVLFVKIVRNGSRLVAEPLLPQLMVTDVERYLQHSSKDFFYITSLTNEQ